MDRPDSWSPHDHVRHYMYEGIWEALEGVDWGQASRWRAVEFGGREDSAPQMMLRALLGDRLVYVVTTYPDVDIMHAPYRHDSCDIVVADQVLEHVERPWKAAEEIHRILHAGGIAIVATPYIHPVHPAPLDCFRIGPDGYDVLFPDDDWERLALGGWGDLGMVRWECNATDMLQKAPVVTVEQAQASISGYGPTGLTPLPIVLWYVGRKRA